MSKSTGPIVAVGAVTIGTNQVIENEPWNDALPVMIMTGAAALLLFGLEHVSEMAAVGLAWIALIARVFVVKSKGGQSPVDAFLGWFKGGAM